MKRFYMADAVDAADARAKPAHVVLAERATEISQRDGLSYSDACIKVLMSDADLASRYRREVPRTPKPSRPGAAHIRLAEAGQRKAQEKGISYDEAVVLCCQENPRLLADWNREMREGRG